MSEANMMSPKQRSSATDVSSVNKSDFYGGQAPANVNYAQPFVGKTGKGPSEVIQGIYVQPEAGRAK